MKPSNPLDLLIEQSRKARDHAGRALAEDRRNQQLSARQLDTLRQYRHEYYHKLHDALTRGIDVGLLNNYQHFMLSLETAIDSAGEKLEQHENKVGASQQHWRQRQKQLSSYDTLAERRATRQRAAEARQEQRGTDEHSSNAHSRLRPRGHDA